MKRIGPTFGDEILAAGLHGLPFAWGEDGDFCGRENLSPAENATLDAVIAAHNPDAARAVDVKAEAARRIDLIMPDYKQRNVMAWGLETIMAYGPDPADWPAELQAVNNQAQAAWAAIKGIRVRSDEIEAMDPIPADFRDDGWWA